jgi:protein phosphatase
MNESTAYSQSDDLDTDELTQPGLPPKGDSAEGEEAGDADSEVVTGLIEVIPGEQQTAIINKAADASTASLTEEEPVMRVVKHCHVGAVRDRNEDSCLVFVSEAGGHFALMPFGLYIVADGMGGHANGHVASKIATRVAAQNIISNIYLPLLQDDASYQPPIQEVMSDAVSAANTAIYRLDAESDSGTTLTIALILGSRLYISHVGDSRLYLFSDEKLESVSTDHSLVQRLQEVGQLTAEEATYHQYRNVLLRAVGQTEEVEVDSYMRRLPKSGRLLLCSDGLAAMVPDSRIQEILEQNEPLQETADQLLEESLSAGGYDNITIVLVEFAL